ncbi:MAG TPA: ORF6N domain-containing protein, partial [Candidatus Synoicihabitans sp.]|nr:ORF6N domain-containing protein [Candidatus Synoicihabitans sp.]
ITSRRAKAAATERMATPSLPAIYSIRRQKVVLDAELAALFGVTTKAFNQAIKRNLDRFPKDFAFQLTAAEFRELKSARGEPERTSEASRSQTVTLKPGGRGQHRKYLPWVFTEHGAIMSAMLLRSDHAVAMSIYVVRAFVQMRETLMANAHILKRLAEIDRRLLEHDTVLREVITRLQPLLDGEDEEEIEPKRKIGYHSGNR